MFGRNFLRSALVSTALATTVAALPAAAQTGPAPVRQSIDTNGVDLFLGTINYDGPTLSAGQDSQTGLSFRKLGRSGGGGDSVWAELFISGSTTYVSFGGTSDSFTASGSSYTPTEANGSSLVLSGNVYTYTARDGSVAHFDKLRAGAYPHRTAVAMVTDITRADGSSLTYAYDSLYYCSSYKQLSNGPTCLQHSYAYRNGSVTSKGSYRLTLQYNEIEPVDEMNGDFPDFATWGSPVGVAMTNTAITGSSTRTQTFVSTDAGGGTSNLVITDPMNRATTFRFAATGFGIKLPGSSSEDVTVTYSSGKVATVTNAVGTWTYSYSDASGVRTVTVSDPANKATVYTFDIASSRMKSMTDATSRGTTWNYDTSGRVTRVTAQEGNYVQTTYDSRGNAIQSDAVSKSGTSTISTYAGYDPTCTNPATCNQPNTTTDARGNVTEYAYNADGTQSTVTAPAPTTGATRPKATYTYTSVNGVSMLGTSSVCRTTASCTGTADETKTSVTYNANGLPDSTTTKAGDNSLSATTTIGYDDVGNVTSVDGPLSGSDDTTTWRYDADREAVGAIGPDPDGSGSLVRAATRNTYDARGRVYVAAVGTVTDTSDSAWAAFSEAYHLYSQYDARGLVIRQTMWSAGVDYAVTDYLYDLVGRRTCAIRYMDPAQWGPQATSCAPLQTNGPMGPDRAVRTSYDDAGRVTKVQTAYGITGVQSDDVTSAYTANGQVQSVTDAENNITSYEYDGFDRLLKTKYPSTTKGAGASNASDYEQLTYDDNGNVTNRRLRDNTNIGYTYDALGRVIAKDLPGSEPDVAYTYDLLAQPLTAVTSAQTVTLGYDALGRMTSQTTGTGTVGYQYDLAGRRTRLTWPDNFYVTYDYDTAGNLKAIKESGSTTLATFSYDSLGRRTKLARGNGVDTDYTFDAASRLTQIVSNPAGTSYDLTLGMSYNPAGQIKSTTRSNDAYAWTGAANVNRGYMSNGLNQLTLSGAVSLGYDARGNLTSSGSDSYTYSSENLLLTGPTGASLSYDPLLRLYQVSNTATAAARFTYDGGNLIATSNTSGTFARRYVTVPGSDEIIAEYKLSNSSIGWKILDERGSVVNSTDPSGVATTPNTYDEYGIPGNNAMRYQYTGQIWLPEVGLYYYKARMYSPTLGRFMQTDPIGYGDGMNWYNYVGGDPVNGSDPSGLDTVIDGKRTCSDRGDCGTILDRLGRDFPYVFDPNRDYDSGGRSDIVVSATGTKPKPPAPGKAPQRTQTPTCSGPRANLGGGVSATGFLGLLGLSGGLSANVSVPTGSLSNFSLRGIQFSISGSITPLAGVGLFLGAGPSYSAGGSSGASGNISGSITPTIQAGAGDGAGVEVGTDFSSPLSGSVAMGRIAGGAYGAVGARFSGTASTNPIGCH